MGCRARSRCQRTGRVGTEELRKAGSVAGALSKFGGLAGLTPRAGGGDVSSGGAYLVGENGPELFSPRASGSITPTSGLGGGGTTYIDARGADLGVLNRISRAQEAYHRDAVSRAVQVGAERSKRTPQKRY